MQVFDATSKKMFWEFAKSLYMIMGTIGNHDIYTLTNDKDGKHCGLAILDSDHHPIDIMDASDGDNMWRYMRGVQEGEDGGR